MSRGNDLATTSSLLEIVKGSMTYPMSDEMMKEADGLTMRRGKRRARVAGDNSLGQRWLFEIAL